MIGGIRLSGKKESSLLAWTIRRPKGIDRVCIPLAQAVGNEPVPCVKVGDRVRIGQKIAEPSGFFSVALHTGICGEVTALGLGPHPLRGEGMRIEISSDKTENSLPEIGRERPGWESLSRQDLRLIFQESGLVGLGGSRFPLHLRNPWVPGREIHTLLINVCESEPYVTADHALIMSHAMEILKGTEILRRMLGAERVIIALEDNKREPAELIKSKIYFLKWSHVEVKILPSRYPQGALLPLVSRLCGADFHRTVSRIPTFERLHPAHWIYLWALRHAGISIHGAATTFAVYEAVVLQKPLYERAVTVSGECVIEPRNLWLPFGTSLREALKMCRGLMREPEKLVTGGPMTGTAQPNADIPVIKSTDAILALPKEAVCAGESKPCIHCGLCVDACPAEISPVLITLAAEQGNDQEARQWGIEHCIGCGICSYVCPARRRMQDIIESCFERLREKHHLAGEGYAPARPTTGTV